MISNSIMDAFCFWKYDFVFAYFYRKSFFVALIAALLGRRTYFTGGIDDLDENYASRKRFLIQTIFFRLCYWIAKSCIIVSESDMRNAIKILGKNKRPAKLSYSEHTINVGSFNANEIVNKSNLFTTIVWMGNEGNVKRKGVDLALRVFAKLRTLPSYADYQFAIIGKKGRGTPYVESIIRKYGLENAVILTGEVSEKVKIKLLSRSKYYFQLSIYEGFGLAALEALAAKNIVIHSAKGGLANSIFSSGVVFNINSSHYEESIEDLNQRLLHYDVSQLEQVSKKIIKHYDNSRRQDDFKKIISELNF